MIDEEPTLRVTPNVLATPAMVMVLLALLVGFAEFVVHIDGVRRLLLWPSFDSSSRLGEIQLAQLENFAREHGGVDCLMLGSSLALFGIDPAAFGAGFEARTGRSLRVYNAAIDGMMESDVGALAPILVEDYHPWLLVLGISPRDFSSLSRGIDLPQLPWVQYRAGVFSGSGWVLDRFASYRYLLAYLALIDPVRRPFFLMPNPLRSDGLMPNERVVSAAQDLEGLVLSMDASQLRAGLSPDSLAGLDAVAEMHGDRVQIVAVEMPAHRQNIEWMARNPGEYDTALESIRVRATRRGALWIGGAMELPLVDDNQNWADPWHLNAKGAASFGRWLGERVAEAVERGDLAPPPPASSARTRR